MNVIALSLLMLSSFAQIGIERDGVIYLNASEASELIASEPDLQILDVRTYSEFQAGHIEGAIQINYFDPNFRGRLAERPHDVPYLVHCRSGNRSSRAVRNLQAAGIETIYHLDGGLNAWQDAGFRIVQEEAAP